MTNPVYQMAITYGRSHWTKDMLQGEYIKFFEVVNSHPEIEDYIFQGEKGEETGLLHLQGYVKWAKNKKKRCDYLIKLLAEQGMPGVEVRPASTNGQAALRNYAMKENTRVLPPLAKNPDRIKKEEEKKANAFDPTKLPQTMAPWQQKIIDYVTTQDPHSRMIIWIYDQIGNTGKSELGKHLAYKHNAVSLSYSDSKDAFSYIADVVEERGGFRTLVIDLTRTKPKMFSGDDLYATIEAIKNGFIFSPKYKSKAVFFNQPHVVVLSNDKPDMTKMSKDRWKVITLGPNDQIPDHLRKKEPMPCFDIGDDIAPPKIGKPEDLESFVPDEIMITAVDTNGN